MHHTDEDDAFASSTMAAEGSQPEATLAATTSQPELSSDEAARAQCLRCKTNGSQSGKHTCGKRRSTSPAATAAKRARPKRNSTDPAEEPVVVDPMAHSQVLRLPVTVTVTPPSSTCHSTHTHTTHELLHHRHDVRLTGAFPREFQHTN